MTCAGAVAALAQLDRIDRAQVRRRFEERWTARRMADDYLTIYRRLARVRPTLRAVGD